VHRESRLCRVLFLGHSTKRFAECQRAPGKEKQPLRRRVMEIESLPSVRLTALGKEIHFAECPPDSTRQRTARGAPLSGTLPSAWYGTRQIVVLCRVSEPLHSAKNLYRCPGLGSLPSAMPLTSFVPLRPVYIYSRSSIL
jgi:hypothetical protein